MSSRHSSLEEQADLVLKRGLVYTMDKNCPIANALAVKGDRIVYVGDDTGVLHFTGSQTRVIDLEGNLVLPGFFDSHTHATCGADEIYSVMLNRLDSVAEYRHAIRDFLYDHHETKLLRGVGWHPPLFPPEGPSRELLDELAPDIPAVLYAQDYHSAWVNTKALELAGIDKDTPVPVGGIIERDPEGHPSGTLRESAMDLVERVVPAYSVDQLVEGLIYFQQAAHSYGITAIHIPYLGDVEREIEALYRLEDEGFLKLRVVAGLVIQPDDDLSIIEKLIKTREAVKRHPLKKGNRGQFEIKTAKIFMDGVIEGGTAYLEQPYIHKPNWRGESLWDVDRYKSMCAALDRAGFQIHVHAIGDAAVRIALDGLAFTRQVNQPSQSEANCILHHGVTHLQLVNPEDIPRFADLHAVAFPQPFWFVIDPFYDQAVEYLGQMRADCQYPMKSFFDCGVLVASASDYPVTIPPRPMDAIEKGVTRAQLGETDSTRALVPSERVTVPQMIASFSINAARAFSLDDMTGSIETGKKADLIVLDKNIFELEPRQIHTSEILLTIFDGQEVFRHISF